MDRFKLNPSAQIGELLEMLREAQAIGQVRSREEAIQFVEDYLDGK